MTDGFLVGLDVGTSGVKAVAFTTDGAVVGVERVTYDWCRTTLAGGIRGTELSAPELADHALNAVVRLLDKLPFGRVHGVGIASMAESSVALDAAGRPVLPIIAWHDKRDTAQLDDLAATIGADAFSATTGLPFRQQWSLTKYRWLRDAGVDTASTWLRLNVAEWIAFTLGAAPVAEQSLASRTGWLDVVERRWWPDALAWSGIEESTFPPLVRSGDPVGTANRSFHPRLEGAVLTIAGHDHQAAAVGLGATTPGDQVDSCGTAEALVRTVEPLTDRDRVLALTRVGATVGWHALPGRWCVLAGTEGGLRLGTVLDALGLTGFVEAEDGHNPAAERAWREVVADVTDEVGALDDAVSAVIGGRGPLIVTGGWSNSPALIAAKRSRLGALTRPEVAEAGARGAAIFAGRAAALWTGEAPWRLPADGQAAAPVQ